MSPMTLTPFIDKIMEEVNPILDSVACNKDFCRLMYGPDCEAVSSASITENTRGARNLDISVRANHNSYQCSQENECAYVNPSCLYKIPRENMAKTRLDDASCIKPNPWVMCSTSTLISVRLSPPPASLKLSFNVWL